MIRTDEWKYVYRAHGDCELYHLPTDPDETNNRVREEELAPVRAALKRRLLEWYQDT